MLWHRRKRLWWPSLFWSNDKKVTEVMGASLFFVFVTTRMHQSPTGDASDMRTMSVCVCFQVRDIVACREREDRDVQLVASPWLTEGAIRARNQREEMVGDAHK